ncbi:hypothetical protein [Stutzerimonas stutzeri]|uniref:hypothetical protein n=1 Tax=Stutzerimonas stutzeri TaxID=316 RepID=UPI001C2F05D6|nr:hypothetical protein [Stutzerimonas stutzeri]
MLIEPRPPRGLLAGVTAKVRRRPGGRCDVVIDFRLGQPRLASLIPIESNKEGFQ